VSFREKLLHIEKQSGKHPSELDVDPIPEQAADAWNLWCDLHAGRSSNGMALVGLSWLDIQAWSQMREHKPTFTELELIRTIDGAFLKVNSPQPRQEN
jgi:hypothetical protein